MLNPTSLKGGLGLVRMQKNQILVFKCNWWSRSVGGVNKQAPPIQAKNTLLVHKLTWAQLKEKREKGLCFKCNGKWNSDHKLFHINSRIKVNVSNKFVSNSAWWLRHGFRSTIIKGVGPNIMGFRSTYYRVQFKGVKGYVKWAEGSRARNWF